MMFSEERLVHLAHVLSDAMWKSDLVDYPSEDKSVREIKKVLMDYFAKDDKVDAIVRTRIASIKRGIFEGSREWEILYNQYFEEEMKKLL